MQNNKHSCAQEITSTHASNNCGMVLARCDADEPAQKLQATSLGQSPSWLKGVRPGCLNIKIKRRDSGFFPNAAEPQPKKNTTRTANASRFMCINVICRGVHPALKAHLSRPLVHFSGSYGCSPSA